MLNLLTLESRKVTAKLKVERAIKTASQQGLGKKIFSKLAQFANWAFGKIITTFNLDFDRLWDMCVDAYFVLKEFDWNQTDKELQAQIEANNKTIAVAGSRALGEQVGIGTVRLVTASVGKFLPGKKGAALQSAEGIKIPVLSKRIALDLAKEQNTQLRADTINFLESASRAMTSNALINAVLFTRKYELLGAKPITQEIEANGSIAAKIERKIQTLPKGWQAPTEAFLEGVEQGIINAGYVVAGTLDDEVAAMRQVLREQREGPTITVEATLADGKEMVFVGQQDEIREAMRSAIPLAPLLDQGDPAVPATWALKPGSDRPQLVVVYRAQNKNKSTHSLHIPHYSGGESPRFPDYEAGPWMGFWVLADGSKLQVYAATEKEAGNMIRALSKHIPAKLKTNRPRYIQTDQRILKKNMKWVSATFYPKGLSDTSTWKAYRD